MLSRMVHVNPVKSPCRLSSKAGSPDPGRLYPFTVPSVIPCAISYSFTAPSVIPCTNSRCIARKRAMMGRMESSVPAISMPYSWR